MSAAFERGACDRRIDDRTAEHRDRPWNLRVAEHREIHIERLDDRRRTPQRRAATDVASTREIELHERSGWECAGGVVREHDAQKTGFEHCDAGTEPALATDAHLVRDVRERIRVDE